MPARNLLMKRYAARYTLEFLVIFLGVLVSFSVQQWSEDKREVQETRRLIYTLTTEIESNLRYCQEHLKQLRNMQLVNQAVLDESRLDRDFLIDQHNQHPFGHSYLDDGNYRYWTTEEDYEKLHLLDGHMVEHIRTERNFLQLVGGFRALASHRGPSIERIHRGGVHNQKKAGCGH